MKYVSVAGFEGNLSASIPSGANIPCLLTGAQQQFLLRYLTDQAGYTYLSVRYPGGHEVIRVEPVSGQLLVTDRALEGTTQRPAPKGSCVAYAPVIEQL